QLWKSSVQLNQLANSIDERADAFETNHPFERARDPFDPRPAGDARFRLGCDLSGFDEAIEPTVTQKSESIPCRFRISAYGRGTDRLEVANCDLKFEVANCNLKEAWWRSEEHTSELQSRGHLVCR